MRSHSSYACPLACTIMLLGAACGGGGGDDGGGGVTPPQTLSVAAASPSGNGQSAAPGAQLADPLRVAVRRGSTPVSGTAVTWSVGVGGGQVTPTSSTTDDAGIASTRWTLGSLVGAQSATASVSGAANSPVTFTATATGTGPGASVVTVENNLFNPTTITVAANTTVRWDWAAGSLQHNIIPIQPATIPSDPAISNAPHSYQVTFAAPGSYNYYCSVHGSPTSGMRGTVVVQ
ncbi:MAG: cupredoxin domain-containing protein [Gemmatimonadaceae bacterium]